MSRVRRQAWRAFVGRGEKNPGQPCRLTGAIGGEEAVETFPPRAGKFKPTAEAVVLDYCAQMDPDSVRNTPRRSFVRFV
jgi:hypothetical protein